MHSKVLTDKIESILRENPGLTARQIGEFLGVDKRDVNSCLYSSDLFVKDDSLRPLWYVDDEDVFDESEQVSNDRSSEIAVSRKSGIHDFDFGSLRPWQTAALKAWNNNGRNGLVEAVTGTGKTRLAIAAIAEELSFGGKVAIIVPTIELQRQWCGEVEHFFPKVVVGLMGNGHHDQLTDCDVLIAIVHSASKNDLGLRHKELGLLVADECHRYGAETFREALEDHFTSRLGLTATRERPDGAHKDIEKYFDKVVYALGYKEAVGQKYIADVKVAQIGVQLDSVEQAEFDELSELIVKTQFELSRRFGIRADPYSRFMEEVTRISAEGEMRDRIAANTYLSAISKRKTLLANSAEKLKVVRYLADAVKESNGTLFFTETIDGAEEIAHQLSRDGIVAATIHSRLNARERQHVFAGFEDGDIQALTAARVLDEGVDVPEADLAVIISASKTRRQMIQRMGRVLRLKADGRQARFVFVYVAGTSEDPTQGGHDAFWNEVLDIATSVDTFKLPKETRRLTRFLSPHSNS
jgi:RNA polymerase primary sigma factor